MKSAPHPARIALDAYYRFIADDGWAIASHIALSALMALFPFLIVVTSLAASALGSKALADEAARLLLEAWPEEVAGPIANEIHKVLTTTRGDVLTVGVALAVYFASSGIESLRIGLNRAYDMVETRNWLLLRLESIGYVLIAALALPLRHTTPMYLADGSRISVEVYDAVVLWDGKERMVGVHSIQGGALLGMWSLYGSRLLLDAVDGGPVTITPIP